LQFPGQLHTGRREPLHSRCGLQLIFPWAQLLIALRRRRDPDRRFANKVQIAILVFRNREGASFNQRPKSSTQHPAIGPTSRRTLEPRTNPGGNQGAVAGRRATTRSPDVYGPFASPCSGRLLQLSLGIRQRQSANTLPGRRSCYGTPCGFCGPRPTPSTSKPTFHAGAIAHPFSCPLGKAIGSQPDKTDVLRAPGPWSSSARWLIAASLGEAPVKLASHPR